MHCKRFGRLESPIKQQSGTVRETVRHRKQPAENNPQANCCYPSFPENRCFRRKCRTVRLYDLLFQVEYFRKWGIRNLLIPRRGRNHFHASQNSSRFQSVGSRLCRREILRIPSHDLRLYRVWRQLLLIRHGRLDGRHTADTQSLVRQLSYQPRLR